MAKIRVRPKDGYLVRDPRNMRRVPPEGIEVDEHDPYWNRRLIAGDVVRADAPAAPAADEAPAARKAKS